MRVRKKTRVRNVFANARNGSPHENARSMPSWKPRNGSGRNENAAVTAESVVVMARKSRPRQRMRTPHHTRELTPTRAMVPLQRTAPVRQKKVHGSFAARCAASRGGIW